MPDDRTVHMENAAFSGKRFVVELLAGSAIGSLAAYATYSALCSGRDCLGPALAGFGVSFAVTPLAVYGVGRWMDGDGSLGWTYLGASTAVAAFSVPGQPDETPPEMAARIDLELAMSMVFLPVTSALFYELSSHLHYKNWRATANIAPVYTQHHLAGAVGQLGITF